MWARGSAGYLALAGGWLAAGLVASVYVGSVLGVVVALVLFGVWGFFLVFFRDPERSPAGEGVVSAADGRVNGVVREGELWRVSVFMNVTDVHVNRFPLAARVTGVSDAGKGHRPAYRPEASHNRQRSYELATSLGSIKVVQMTGILARRLVSFVRPGDTRARGDRLGMIVLGSRVDVLLPEKACHPVVKVGDRVRAGETVIAVEPRA